MRSPDALNSSLHLTNTVQIYMREAEASSRHRAISASSRRNFISVIVSRERLKKRSGSGGGGGVSSASSRDSGGGRGGGSKGERLYCHSVDSLSTTGTITDSEKSAIGGYTVSLPVPTPPPRPKHASPYGLNALSSSQSGSMVAGGVVKGPRPYTSLGARITHAHSVYHSIHQQSQTQVANKQQLQQQQQLQHSPQLRPKFGFSHTGQNNERSTTLELLKDSATSSATSNGAPAALSNGVHSNGQQSRQKAGEDSGVSTNGGSILPPALGATNLNQQPVKNSNLTANGHSGGTNSSGNVTNGFRTINSRNTNGFQGQPPLGSNTTSSSQRGGPVSSNTSSTHSRDSEDLVATGTNPLIPGSGALPAPPGGSLGGRRIGPNPASNGAAQPPANNLPNSNGMSSASTSSQHGGGSGGGGGGGQSGGDRMSNGGATTTRKAYGAAGGSVRGAGPGARNSREMVEPKYADPLPGAPPTFQQRLAELSALEQDTIRYERAKKFKKKSKPDT